MSVPALNRSIAKSSPQPAVSTIRRFDDSALTLFNRQRTRRIDAPLLRRVIRTLLEEMLGTAGYELGVHCVGTPEITRLNETFLRHAGPTDVIAFDYTSAGQASGLSASAGFQPAGGGARFQRAATPPTSRMPALRDRLECCPALHGEIFVCVDEAVVQARRYRTHWQAELVRYIVHGVLHLRGFSDRHPAARRKMKREEDRLLRELGRRFALARLGRLNQP